MTEGIEKYLKHIKETCQELSDEELEKFSEGLTTSEFNKNDLCIYSGQIQKQGSFLVKGLIRAFHTDSFGNEKNIYFIPENEYAFHYFSFMNQEPCPLSFQCLEPSLIVHFSINHLHNAYETIPNFEKYGRLIMEEKLKNQQQRLESLLYKNAEQRYIDFISQYAKIFDRITISELCSYLGVERQTLTRIRKKISRSE